MDDISQSLGSPLSTILDVVSEAVLVLDAARRVLFANRAAKILLGDIFIGQDFVRTVRHPDCLNCVDTVLSGKRSAQTVITLTQPISTVCQVNVVALDALEHSASRAVVSFDDISEIHEAEKMRSDFVANVSHELRSPLTALSGFIETLKGAAKDDPEAREHFLSVMEGEAMRMDRLIDDLLSLSKVETNVRVRPTGLADIPAIIAQVITVLSVKATERNTTVTLESSDGLPNIPGDTDELTQVFQNLIENAIKYGEPGSDVLVSISEVETVPAIRGAAVCVKVRDKGAGISRGHIPRLTERFYRVDEGRSRDEGGTGLGLAIVKHIVSRHRGRLVIKSEIGVGSTFSVYLPMAGTAP